ncbi:MAG: hypothetical protein HY759_05765 [Nitrospirae bacterium]|nr:hypothetical protein [Nitrospirota bacterium]
MLAIFLDVQTELKEIFKEYTVLQKKLTAVSKTEDPDIMDSHIRAIAGCTHSIYIGMENILKSLIKYLDKELPVGDDWHIQLIKRAKYPNENIRPAIISEETSNLLDELRGFRHVFRSKYHSLLIPEKVLERANDAINVFNKFTEDIELFIKKYEAGK